MSNFTISDDEATVGGPVVAMLPEVRRAARAAAADWPDVTTVYDLEQDITLRLLGSPGTVQALDAMDDRLRLRALERIGHQVASRHRADLDHFHGAFRYINDDVRDLLDRGAIEPDVGELANPAANDYGDVSSDISPDVVDIRIAFEQLWESNPEYAELLERRYIHGIDIRDESGGKSESRAVTKLRRLMNANFRQRGTNHDGPGSRRAISNARAQAMAARNT